MARVRFGQGRVIVSGPPLPSVIKAPPPGHGVAGSQAPAHSQAPFHGQGLGLAILGGGSSGGQQGGGGTPAFPHTSILDNFNRADNASLGANWTRLNPGGALGYTSTEIGISGNAAYDPDTAGANTASAAWTAATYAGTVEAYFTIGVVPGNLAAVTLRCNNVNGIAVVYYWAGVSGTTWAIHRADSFSSDTTLTNGATGALNVGDKIGGRVYTVGGNPKIELWLYRVATATWAIAGSVTDSSAQKLTADGNIGVIWGNANGSSVGRMDDFGGGAS